MNYTILFIVIISIIGVIIMVRNNGKMIADTNDSNYGNIIDRMIVLYLLCEGDRHKFKKLKTKYFNENIYTDAIFLFDFDYRFNITVSDRIILIIQLFFLSCFFLEIKFNL